MLKRPQRSLAIAAIALAALWPAVNPTFAKETASATGCWTRPAPRSIAEAARLSDNRSNYDLRKARARSKQPAALLLSDGNLKTGFAAGHLVGWSETGTRPDFDTVTAVGPSALIAPFAFIGTAGDRHIADLFACPPSGWKAMADRSIAMIDDNLLDAIAALHQTGKRLLVAVQGNAARRSGYWNIGWIVAHRRSEAKRLIRSIFAAAIDLSSFPDTGVLPAPAGRFLPRNYAFRHMGSGNAVLPPIDSLTRFRTIYVLHNGVLRTNDDLDFAKKMRGTTVKRPNARQFSLRTVHHLRRAAATNLVPLHIASVKQRRWFYPKALFDPVYVRTVFTRSHRTARMGRLWLEGAR